MGTKEKRARKKHRSCVIRAASRPDGYCHQELARSVGKLLAEQRVAIRLA
jgi:hypothetical protein